MFTQVSIEDLTNREIDQLIARYEAFGTAEDLAHADELRRFKKQRRMVAKQIAAAEGMNA